MSLQYHYTFDINKIEGWEGDTALFKIENNHLRLQAPAEAGTARIYSPIEIADRVTWEIKLKMAFAPSDQNHARIYLATDRQGISYYIKLGENGNADALTFYREEAGNSTLLFRGISGRIADQKDSISVKIDKNEFGEWQFYTAINQEAYVHEGDCIHQLSLKGACYIGIACHYSSTRSTLFWFDKFKVNTQLLPDTLPPAIEEVVIADEQLKVIFNEKINTTAFDQYGQLYLNKQQINHTWLNDHSLVITSKYNHGENLLEFNAISDKIGNQTTLSHNFWYQSVKQFDIVINELMVKPSPSVFLPEVQYLELYNRSNYPIQLKDWSYTDDRETIYLDDYILLPDAYVIIVQKENQALFQNYIPSIGLTKTIHLTISGKKLSLYDENKQLIHDVTYRDAWHSSSAKRAGGWSLEMIDPDNPCKGADNWKSSVDKKGGTPGAKNSVFASNPDNKSPQVLNMGFKTHDTLFVRFSEKILPFVQNQYNILQFQLYEDWMTIALPEKIKQNEIREIHLNQFTDCVANALDTLLFFQLPQVIEYNDVVFNELLYDPSVGGVRFVEIYNRTNNVYDLQELKFVEYASDEIKSVNALTTEPYLIQANEYIVLCSDMEVLKQYYFVPNNARYTSMALPALDRSRGDIVLLNNNMNTIDSLHYENTMHWSLISDRKGVSLERIDTDVYTNHSNNWFSASSSVGFATPGYENSSKRIDNAKDNKVVSLSSPYFSPNHDGHMDLLFIDYTLPEYGYMAEINVYSTNGFLLKKLHYGTVANQGKVAWDGLDEQGQLVLPGNYVIHCSFYHNEGVSLKERLTVAVVYKP